MRGKQNGKKKTWSPVYFALDNLQVVRALEFNRTKTKNISQYLWYHHENIKTTFTLLFCEPWVGSSFSRQHRHHYEFGLVVAQCGHPIPSNSHLCISATSQRQQQQNTWLVNWHLIQLTLTPSQSINGWIKRTNEQMYGQTDKRTNNQPNKQINKQTKLIIHNQPSWLAKLVAV